MDDATPPPPLVSATPTETTPPSGGITPIARTLCGEDGALARLTAVRRAASKGREVEWACVGLWGLFVEAFPEGTRFSASALADKLGHYGRGKAFDPYIGLLREAGWLDSDGRDITGAVTRDVPKGMGGWLRVPKGSLAEILRRAHKAGHSRCLAIVGVVILLGLRNAPGITHGVQVRLESVEDKPKHVSDLRRRLIKLGVLTHQKKGRKGVDWLKLPPASSMDPQRDAAGRAATRQASSPTVASTVRPDPARPEGSWGGRPSPQVVPTQEEAAVGTIFVHTYARSAPIRAREEAGVDMEVDVDALIDSPEVLQAAASTSRTLAKARLRRSEPTKDDVDEFARKLGETLDWRVNGARDLQAEITQRLERYEAKILKDNEPFGRAPVLSSRFDPANDGVIEL